MKSAIGFWLWVMFQVCVASTSEGQSLPMIKFRQGCVWVTGFDLKMSISVSANGQWKEILRVYTREAFVKELNQPVAGTYTSNGDSITFKPNFSFSPGERYHVVFNYQSFLTEAGSKQVLPETACTLALSFLVPLEEFIPTFIESVHPQAEILPENMLRMYISFSAPMMSGEAYDHIRLLTEDGTPVEKAFLMIDQELWDTERKRFTLLFDPGRVKRGIQSNLDLGAPLQAGQKYQLVIDSTWRDAHGNSMSASFRKSFTVTSAERKKLSTTHWKIVTPAPESREDLMIYFDRPVDYALALKCITITGTRSGKVTGTATLTNSNLWRFRPDHPWREDDYQLEIYPLMEDVAGNNFNNAFDVDLSKEKRVSSSEGVRCGFVVGSEKQP